MMSVMVQKFGRLLVRLVRFKSHAATVYIPVSELPAWMECGMSGVVVGATNPEADVITLDAGVSIVVLRDVTGIIVTWPSAIVLAVLVV